LGVKVLLLVHNQQGTGPYPKVLEQAEALHSVGCRVTLLCTSRTARLHMSQTEQHGVRILAAPDLLWGSLRQGVDLWNTLRRMGFVGRESFEVIHAIDSRPVVILPALWGKWRLRAPLVMSWWDLFGDGGTARDRWGAVYSKTLGVLEGAFEVSFRRFADRSTVISSHLYERLVATGYPPEHILLQRVGCDTRAYGPSDKLVARAALGLPPHATILCYVGALALPDRTLLVDSLALVARHYGRELLTLMVGTQEFDARFPGHLDVRWTSRQPLPAVYRYIAAADLCLLPMCESPANRARWPSKTADYFNSGRPVVATKVSDFEQLYAEHNLGYLAERSTPNAYAEALLRALNAPSEWEAIGRSCRRFAEHCLDSRVLAQQLVGLYEEAHRTHGVRP
jgi:glycosyltransferase involved in cell wall biosynthesis